MPPGYFYGPFHASQLTNLAPNETTFDVPFQSTPPIPFDPNLAASLHLARLPSTMTLAAAQQLTSLMGFPGTVPPHVLLGAPPSLTHFARQNPSPFVPDYPLPTSMPVFTNPVFGFSAPAPGSFMSALSMANSPSVHAARRVEPPRSEAMQVNSDAVIGDDAWLALMMGGETPDAGATARLLQAVANQGGVAHTPSSHGMPSALSSAKPERLLFPNRAAAQAANHGSNSVPTPTLQTPPINIPHQQFRKLDSHLDDLLSHQTPQPVVHGPRPVRLVPAGLTSGLGGFNRRNVPGFPSVIPRTSSPSTASFPIPSAAESFSSAPHPLLTTYPDVSLNRATPSDAAPRKRGRTNSLSSASVSPTSLGAAKMLEQLRAQGGMEELQKILEKADMSKIVGTGRIH
ncbi:hypothetical protein M427DRAFT_64275 [Gonapodya prolifera JEL478]|uniref:Uncharacterized protein n=1 Tax=Gonapodya prolifera (strain JEL478) TaxID=1344416 RepID=A0A138ZXZ6_GONPJ|nr:hypothetical protein M427DRAFT_64275 [Gonapodya prolifera JEL478]|eukprot:KXS09377.1 hypothetical protein M427DRAFT_64275 [Gonapodya prolifera JEL478]